MTLKSVRRILIPDVKRSCSVDVEVVKRATKEIKITGRDFLSRKLCNSSPSYLAEIGTLGFLICLELQSKEVREKAQTELLHRGALLGATMNTNRIDELSHH